MPQSKKKFNPRKFAFRRKVQVREVIQDLHTNNTLVKNYGCEEFYGDKLSKLENCPSSSYFNVNTSEGGLDYSTPMDVDSSIDDSHSDTMDCSLKHYFTQNQANPQPPFVKPSKHTFSGLTKIFTILLVLLLGLSVYFSTTSTDIQIEKLKVDLRKHVLDQNEAILAITYNLERTNMWMEKSKILPFVGSTGVGKTLTANLIKECFLPQLVHEINGKHIANLNKQDLIINNLSSCCYNLIIIDDLNSSDIENFFHFMEKLPLHNFNLVIIPIFNIQNNQHDLNGEIDSNYFQFIKKKFVESGLYFDFILFDTLDVKIIQTWLKNELYKRNVTQDKHKYIIESLVNENYVKNRGFKGIRSKLALLID